MLKASLLGFKVNPSASREFIIEGQEVISPRERMRRKTTNRYKQATKVPRCTKRHIYKNCPNEVYQEHNQHEHNLCNYKKKAS